MGKLIAVVAVLLLGIACYHGTILSHKWEEDQIHQWALYHEKSDQRDNVLWSAIAELEGRLDQIEAKSGIDARSVVEGKELPEIFRYRLSRPIYEGENRDQLLKDINYALNRAIYFVCVLDVYPDATAHQLFTHYENARFRVSVKDGELKRKATAAYDSIVSGQKTEFKRISSLTIADVPKYRIDWQRQVVADMKK